MIVYDCEIVKAILPKNGDRLQDIEYVSATGQAAWRAFDEMGVSVIGVYDYNREAYSVFCEDNFAEFQELVDATIERDEWVIGFNSLAFDNRLVETVGLSVPDAASYDLLVAMWRAAGLSDTFRYPTHAGFGLDATSRANGGEPKSGHGAMAPVWWQRGEIGRTITYCLDDVRITKGLVDLVLAGSRLRDPRDSERELALMTGLT